MSARDSNIMSQLSTEDTDDKDVDEARLPADIFSRSTENSLAPGTATNTGDRSYDDLQNGVVTVTGGVTHD